MPTIAVKRTKSFPLTDAEVMAKIRRATKPKTCKELKTTPIQMADMLNRGLVKAGPKVQTGQRGRPAHTYLAA